MAVELNHTIVPARDAAASAGWLADLLGLDAPVRFGPFWQVSTANGVDLDFDDAAGDEAIRSQHYAFLIGEDDFDAVHGRLVARGLAYFADPGCRQPGRINHHDGGRGVYFPDPDGHLMEVITRPYGGG